MGINRRHSLAWSFVVMLVGLAMVVAGCGGSGGSSPSGGTGKIVMRLSSHGMVTSKVSAAMGVDASSESSILGTSGKVSLDIYNSNDNRDKLDLYSKEQQSYTVDSKGEATVESDPVLANRSYYVHTTVTPDGSSTAYTSDLWVYVEPNKANVASPIVVPTPSPSVSPTASPSPSPSASPTASPTASPSPSPTIAYTAAYLCPKDYSVSKDGTAVLDSAGKTIDPDNMELSTQEMALGETYKPLVVGKTEEGKYVQLDDTEASLEVDNTNASLAEGGGTEVVSIDGLTIVGKVAGTAVVHATVGELKSNTLTFEVEKKEITDARLSFLASDSDYVAFYYQKDQSYPSRGLLTEWDYDVAVEVLYKGETDYTRVSASDFKLVSDNLTVTLSDDGSVWKVTTGDVTSASATLTYIGDDTATWTNVIKQYISPKGSIDLTFVAKPESSSSPSVPTAMKIELTPSQREILNKTEGLSGEPTIVHSTSTEEESNINYTVKFWGQKSDGTWVDLHEFDTSFSLEPYENIKGEDGWYYATSGDSKGSFKLVADENLWLTILAYYLHLEGDNFDTFYVNIIDNVPTIAVYAEDATAESIAAGTSKAKDSFDVKAGSGNEFNFTVFKCVGDPTDPNSYIALIKSEGGDYSCIGTFPPGISGLSVWPDSESCLWTFMSEESVEEGKYTCTFTYSDSYMTGDATTEVTFNVSH